MKFALIFLSTFLVVSQQQFQKPRTLNWMSPHIAPRYPDYQPQFYDDFQDNRPSYYRYFRPNIPAIYSEGNAADHRIMDLGVQQSKEAQDDYADIQARIKGLNSMNTFQSPFMQPNARFLFSLFGAPTNSIFPRTVTLTITSTINITSVQLCISTALFVAGKDTIACRRRRNVEKLSNMDDDYNDQFPIEPTQTQLVQGTAIASEDMVMARNYASNKKIESSKDETAMEDESPRARQKRFLFLPISTYLVTSYTFPSTVIIKKAVAVATAAHLQCMPPGYVLC